MLDNKDVFQDVAAGSVPTGCTLPKGAKRLKQLTTTIKMRKRTLFYILFVLSFCCRMTAASGVYDVRKYGAKGDGRTLDHRAINKAIEAATADGGGQVVLSAGTYLCGSIRLKSNVDLHLMAGAKILAAPASMKAYDDSESFGGFPEYQDGGHT